MKEIKLKKLTLHNFKGIKDLTIDFNDVTDIFGENATGKTTINDAFRWLLFDKDSTDRKAFEIKTISETGEVKHGLDHEVTAELVIEGITKTFTKTYREKWTKKRGEAEQTFTGHETTYSIDDVPVKASEYQSEINSIIDENIFKLITDPLYFSQTMKWTERREILLNITGEHSIEDVITANGELAELAELLTNKKISDLKKSIAEKRKKLNEELKQIQPRIDECNNTIQILDFKKLKKELEEAQAELTTIENELNDLSSVGSDVKDKINSLNKLRAEIRGIESSVQSEKNRQDHELELQIGKLKFEKQTSENKLKSISVEIERCKKDIQRLDETIISFREDWDKKKAETLEITDDFTCPTCKRKLDADVISKKKIELLQNFNADKAKQLERITEKGKDAKAELVATLKSLRNFEDQFDLITNETIPALDQQIATIEKKIEDYKHVPLDYGKEHAGIKEQIETLEAELQTPSDTKERQAELKEQKDLLTKEIDRIKNELRKEETNKQMNARIDELSKRERELSQQVADLEKTEFLCEKYERTEAELIEQSVNTRFQIVRFKLFDIQINGGINPTCEPLINGVPFSDANNAAKINAGIDIINTLCDHYQVTAPIFIDNREAVNEIIPTKSQIINLIVKTLYECKDCGSITESTLTSTEEKRVCSACSSTNIVHYKQLKVS